MDQCSPFEVLPMPSTAVLEAIRAHWKLTTRQAEVAVGVARGLSNKEIAAEQSCFEGTVEKHLSDVFKRTRSANRVVLAVRVWLLVLSTPV